MGPIEDINAACEEISDKNEFIRTLAGKAADPDWIDYDPGYTHLKAIYMNARTALIAAANTLPSY